MIKNLLFTTTLMLAIFTASCSDKPQEHFTKGDFIRTCGHNFVDANGEKYNITGINLGNWVNPEGYMFKFKHTNSASEINRAFCQMVGEEYTAYFWKEFQKNYVTRKDIEFIASTGVNSIRLPFHYKLFTDKYLMGSQDSERGYELVDSLITWCKDNELRIILDMHCAPGGQTGDNIDDSYGYPWLFESETHQTEFIKVWCEIAERYKNETTIIGYDLINEPIASHFPNLKELNKHLEPLLIKTSKSIRAIDKNHIIFLGGAQWNSNFDIFTDWEFDNNIAYTFHNYWTETTQNVLDKYVNFREKTNCPLYLGESGENTDEWVREFRLLLDKNNFGWHFWPYKKLDHHASYVHIPSPEDWDIVVDFVEGDRSSYAAIRENRPNQEHAKSILENFLKLSKFENCVTNQGYIDALTK